MADGAEIAATLEDRDALTSDGARANDAAGRGGNMIAEMGRAEMPVDLVAVADTV